jgi:hypothetical protein
VNRLIWLKNNPYHILIRGVLKCRDSGTKRGDIVLIILGLLYSMISSAIEFTRGFKEWTTIHMSKQPSRPNIRESVPQTYGYRMHIQISLNYTCSRTCRARTFIGPWPIIYPLACQDRAVNDNPSLNLDGYIMIVYTIW